MKEEDVYFVPGSRGLSFQMSPFFVLLKRCWASFIISALPYGRRLSPQPQKGSVCVFFFAQPPFFGIIARLHVFRFYNEAVEALSLRSIPHI